MPARIILKESESKPLIESIRKLPGLSSLSTKSRVELEHLKGEEVIFVEGTPMVVRRKNDLIPVLVNSTALAHLPRVVVDMGAVPHVVGGADIMAPGIRKVTGEFSEGQLLVVVDEKFGKHLAVGRALLNSEAVALTKKGKVIENLHFVGDEVWESVKSSARQQTISS